MGGRLRDTLRCNVRRLQNTRAFPEGQREVLVKGRQLSRFLLQPETNCERAQWFKDHSSSEDQDGNTLVGTPVGTPPLATNDSVKELTTKSSASSASGPPAPPPVKLSIFDRLKRLACS